MKKIRKAVFPVAGLGTRFLPATKASPKEMMPIVDKPLIQYAVEEAAAAGITDMIFVTGRTKRAIEDHFDMAFELETELASKGKTRMLDVVRNLLPKSINCIFVRQSAALGLGHAVLCARPVIGEEPFAVLLADDLLDSEVPVMKQMTEQFNEHHCSILATLEVPQADTASYGIVKTGRFGEAGQFSERLECIETIVEKPAPEMAPSNIAVVGRYILTPSIFRHLDRARPGSGGEIQLTDGIAALLTGDQVLAYHYFGRRFDCGSKLGYLQATVEFGLRHPEVGASFSRYLESRASLHREE